MGHVGLSRAWLDARRQLVDIWMLSPLCVLPTRQRTGIGSGLLAAAVDAARAAGAPMLVLEGSPSYYGSRGFERATRHGIRPASARTPDAACQVVLFEGHEEWMTGQVVYRDVWWRHDAAGCATPGSPTSSSGGAQGLGPPWLRAGVLERVWARWGQASGARGLAPVGPPVPTSGGRWGMPCRRRPPQGRRIPAPPRHPLRSPPAAVTGCRSGRPHRLSCSQAGGGGGAGRLDLTWDMPVAPRWSVLARGVGRGRYRSGGCDVRSRVTSVVPRWSRRNW